MRRLNWEAPQSLYDLEFIQDVYTEEFLERLKLVFGASYATAWWGVVDEVDPQTAQTSDSRPLVVRANATLPLTVDVLAGMAVTQTGERIVLTAVQLQRALADSGSAAKNVVYLRSTEAADKNKLTDYDILVPSRYNTAADADLLQVSTVDDYVAMSSTDKEDDVVLAVVTVQPDGAGGHELSIDMTANSYSWNRPWFSPVDIAHRSRIGTGVTTDNNPHGLQINDMVAGGLTLWQLILDYGIIVSEDQSYAKVAGQECTQIVPAGSILLDAAGTVTGFVNAHYIVLLYYPQNILRVTDDASDTSELGARVVKGTRILYFPPDERFNDGVPVAPASLRDLRVRYTWVETGHPEITVPQINLTISNPIPRETMVAGGLQLTELDDETLEFADAGGIPKQYHTFVDASKTVRKRPQVCFCTKKLDAVGAALEPFVISPWGPAKIIVALTGATSGPVPATLQVEIQIAGKDTTGATVTENILFDNTWLDNPPGATAEEPKQFKETTTVWSALTTWKVVNRVDDGANSAVMMWLDHQPVSEETETFADILPLFYCFWDGTQIVEMLDERSINTIAEEPTRSPLEAVVQTQKDIGDSVTTVTETIVKHLTTDQYTPESPLQSLGTKWGYHTVGPTKQRVWMVADPYNDSIWDLIIPFGNILPSRCTLIGLQTGYWLNNIGVGSPAFSPIANQQAFYDGTLAPIPGQAIGGGAGAPTPIARPPIATPWVSPDYQILMTFGAGAPIEQSNYEYFIAISYNAGGAVSVEFYPQIAATRVIWEEETLFAAGSSWNFQQLMVEDFRHPRWVDGTQSTMSKDVDGLGRSNTYYSRPIPFEYAVTGSQQRLRLMLFGISDSANYPWSYRRFSLGGGWSSWNNLFGAGPHDVTTASNFTKIQVRLNPDGTDEAEAIGFGIVHWNQP
jgi:hypothetical protein